jgi:uncharacterized protein (TIGR02271 family)
MDQAKQPKSGDVERKVQIREEQLRPETERVKAGDVEIRKEVVSEVQTQDVPLTREEVEVDYRPVDRRPADQPIGESETIRVPVHKEEITGVKKETVVTGEIDVRKRQERETEQVSDTVRREEPHVEKEGELRVRGKS